MAGEPFPRHGHPSAFFRRALWAQRKNAGKRLRPAYTPPGTIVYEGAAAPSCIPGDVRLRAGWGLPPFALAFALRRGDACGRGEGLYPFLLQHRGSDAKRKTVNRREAMKGQGMKSLGRVWGGSPDVSHRGML